MRLVRTEDLASAAGPILAEAIARSVANTGRCRLALSGGSTPASTFEWLANHLDADLYARLWVTWADERWGEDSNLALARRSWLGRVPSAARVLPLSGDGSLQSAANELSATFESEWGGIDVLQLGVGPDGHIASLFPGHPALGAAGPVVTVTDSPKPPPERLSLSMSVLQGAGQVVLMARGADKAPILRRAWDGDRGLPLGRLGARDRSTWVCDGAAAAELPEDA